MGIYFSHSSFTKHSAHTHACIHTSHASGTVTHKLLFIPPSFRPINHETTCSGFTFCIYYWTD